MQKTCKSEGCQRKFDRTNLSDLCPPCASAFKSGETQTNRRMDNNGRQNRARSTGFNTNRDLSSLPPPPTNQPPYFPSSQSIQPPLFPSSQFIPVTTSAQPMPTIQPMQPMPNTNPTQPTSAINVDKLRETFQNMQQGAASTSENSAPLKDMFGMLLHLCSKGDENEQMKTEISSNTHRLDRLEAKLGSSPDDIAVPLSLAIRNLPLPGPGSNDYELVKALLREINATGVDIDHDIIKVVRQGATGDNQGTVMVEMSCDEVRASVMKTKKCLENHHNPGLRKIIIKNMKPRLELKVDIALNEMLKKFPGGENFFVANNGHIREKNFQQRSYQNNFNSNYQSKATHHTHQTPQTPYPAHQPANHQANNPHQTYSRPPPSNSTTFPTYSMSCPAPPRVSIPTLPGMFPGPSHYNPLMHPVASFPSMSSSSSYTMPSQHPVPMSSAPFIFTGAPQYNPLLNHSDLPVNQSSYQTSQSSQLTSSTDTATLAQQPMSSQSVSSQPDHQPVVSASSSPGHQQNAVSEE